MAIDSSDANKVRVGTLGRSVDVALDAATLPEAFTTSGLPANVNALSTSIPDRIINRVLNAFNTRITNAVSGTNGFETRFNGVVGSETGADQTEFDDIGKNLIQAVHELRQGGAGRYEHDQTTADTVWTVTHNLGTKYVSSQVIDSSGNIVIPDTDWTTSTTTTLTLVFAYAKDGTAIIRR